MDVRMIEKNKNQSKILKCKGCDFNFRNKKWFRF